MNTARQLSREARAISVIIGGLGAYALALTVYCLVGMDAWLAVVLSLLVCVLSCCLAAILLTRTDEKKTLPK